MISMEEKIDKAIEEYDTSLLPKGLVEVNDFYDNLRKAGKIRKKESQLFPSEAYSFNTSINDVKLQGNFRN